MAEKSPTMSRQLPPLNALLAFEAAARHLSFTRAARELHVTQAAISHQVKALEEHLGMPLFHRRPRALQLTDEGQHYLGDVRAALDRLDQATRQLLRRAAPQTLSVSAVPSFAARWLGPRLGRFRQLHPEIDVCISASTELVDFARADVDVGIRSGRGRYLGLRSDFLLSTSIFPVCGPDELRAGRRPFELALPPGGDAYYLVCPQETADRPKIRAFREWLLAEVAAEGAA